MRDIRLASTASTRGYRLLAFFSGERLGVEKIADYLLLAKESTPVSDCLCADNQGTSLWQFIQGTDNNISASALVKWAGLCGLRPHNSA
jgi:hypothetical protein